MKKVNLFFISIFISIIGGIIFFFMIFIALSINLKNSNPHPEHGVSPIGGVIFAFIVSIPISILILFKIYKFLVKKYH